MNRKRTIALAGIALLGGLALIENATRSVEVVPANVISVTPLVTDIGPDQFEVIFELSDHNAYTADPVDVRPLLGAGDPVCVRMHTHSWAKRNIRSQPVQTVEKGQSPPYACQTKHVLRASAPLDHGTLTVPPPTAARTPVVPAQLVGIPRATRTAR